MTSLAAASAKQPYARCRPRQALDVGAPDREQPQMTLLAPGGELAQVQSVSVAGQAGVTS
jgi:hypothetical protein